MLSSEAVGEFKSLYLKEYGITLTNDQATNLGTMLVRLVKAVYGSDVPKKWLPKIDRDKKED